MTEQQAPRFDWLRAIHRVAVLVRTVRGDSDVQTDHALERTRGSDMRASVEGLGREIDKKVAEEKTT